MTVHMNHTFSNALNVRESALDFLWLELTNRCNLQCVHCYTESNPHSGHRDILTKNDYESLMFQAHQLGCRKIQFIGGEPQLNGDFHTLLIKAKDIGFDFIEVFSNLTRLENKTIGYAAANDICFATSVYSNDPTEHDAITKVGSSHARTVANLKKLVAAGIKTRAAIISINQNKSTIDRTKAFLIDLGVKHVSHGQTREFGRGEAVLEQSARLSGLCGHCWAGKLCIAPDGAAYPCVMARQWPVGNVLETSLGDIVGAQSLKDVRQQIFDTVWLPKTATRKASNKSTVPNRLCTPSDPKCGPDIGAPDCAPELSAPQREKYPDGSPTTDPAEECPQSCVPDESTCGPIACPQSCDPNLVEEPEEEEVKEECPQSCVPDQSTCGPIACPQSCLPNRIG
jgi:MoaA/NifB/PqqE/SkfB family radical SAM enzyme